MTKNSTCFLLTVLALAIAASGCETMPEEPKQAETKPAQTCSPAGAPSDPNRLAQGAQFDSLEACMSRIPCEASESQRMLAEQSCKSQFAAEGRKHLDEVKENKRDPGGPLGE